GSPGPVSQPNAGRCPCLPASPELSNARRNTPLARLLATRGLSAAARAAFPDSTGPRAVRRPDRPRLAAVMRPHLATRPPGAPRAHSRPAAGGLRQPERPGPPDRRALRPPVERRRPAGGG